MPNLWKSFEKMLPKEHRVIGKVISVDTVNGLSTITLLNGTVSTSVKGTDAGVDKFVLVKDGVIIQTLPDIVLYDNLVVY